jgi:hypothetical protein
MSNPQHDHMDEKDIRMPVMQPEIDEEIIMIDKGVKPTQIK